MEDPVVVGGELDAGPGGQLGPPAALDHDPILGDEGNGPGVDPGVDVVVPEILGHGRHSHGPGHAEIEEALRPRGQGQLQGGRPAAHRDIGDALLDSGRPGHAPPRHVADPGRNHDPAVRKSQVGRKIGFEVLDARVEPALRGAAEIVGLRPLAVVMEIAVVQAGSESVGPGRQAVGGAPAPRPVLIKQLVEDAVQGQPGIVGFAVAVVLPEAGLEDTRPAHGLFVSGLEGPLELLPPAARLGIGPHAAVHVLAVGGRKCVVGGDGVIRAVRVVGQPVGHDEALPDRRVGDVGGQASLKREVVTEMELGVAERHVPVLEIAAAPVHPHGH